MFDSKFASQKMDMFKTLFDPFKYSQSKVNEKNKSFEFLNRISMNGAANE